MPSQPSKRKRLPSSTSSRPRRSIDENLTDAEDSQLSRTRRRRAAPSHPATANRHLEARPHAANGAADGGAVDDDLVETSAIMRRPSFRPGNITHIRMTNFLTFSDTTFIPGPRMNLVIGPNGSGKSTIVSAVCIVFGGKPSILGRSPDLGAFVKYGCAQASIEAWLYEPEHPEGRVAIKRVFNQDGKGYFKIDDCSVTQIELNKQVVEKYDIQLDNLTQFMPQEKVAEFTNHRPDELLNLAIRALGGVEREETYHQLVEADKKLETHTDTLKRNYEELRKLMERQEQETEEVQSYREQQALQRKLAVLHSLRPCVNAAELSVGYNVIKAKLKEVSDEVNAMVAKFHRDSSGPLNACKQQVEAAVQMYTSFKESTVRLSNGVEEALQSAEEVSVSISKKMKDWRDAEVNANRLRESVRLGKEKVREARERRDALSGTSVDKLKEDRRHFDRQRAELRGKASDEDARKVPVNEAIVQAERAIRHFNSRLSGLADARQQRLHQVGRMKNGDKVLQVEKIVRDLRERGEFSARVYGPVCTEVEVRDQYHAKIMEHTTSGFLMTAFVTETMQDSRKILSACDGKFGRFWSPATITVPTTRDDKVDLVAIQKQVPNRPIDDRLRGFGLADTVDGIYQAPDPVRAALNAHAGLHNIYVGTRDSIYNQDALRQEQGVMTWYTPVSRCSVTGSRYNSSLRNMRVDTSFEQFSGSVYVGSMHETERQREELKQKIQIEEDRRAGAKQDYESIEKVHGEIMANMRQVEIETRRILEEIKKVNDAEGLVDTMKRHLANLQLRADQEDVNSKKKYIEDEIVKLKENAVDRAAKMLDVIEQLRDSASALDEKMVGRVSAEQKYALESSKYKDAEGAIISKKKEKMDMKEEKDRLKIEWKKASVAAQHSLSAEQGNDYEDLVKHHLERPSQHLEEAIDQVEAQVREMGIGGQSVLEEFEQRQRRIDRLQHETDKQKEFYEKRQERLGTERREFLKWLENGIERMRKKFSYLYTRLGCAGDLRLSNVDDTSLSDLTLEVLVSYRKDVELRPVSAQSNSGGEKMCCTMIFCFSLQLEEERVPPFVMVDELNQGLDPSNEMKIMTMMIEDASKESASQSFVVTPKLLSNLPLHSEARPHIKTHIVYNGPVKGKEDILEAAA